MKVLVAEDDRSTRRELETVLVRSGYDVVVAGDGAEAWGALLCRDAPQLVILDWMMPNMDGIEVCRNVRESFEPGSVYIVILTFRDRREDVVEGFKAGADDYITKPFNHKTLRERLAIGSRIIDSHADFSKHKFSEIVEAKTVPPSARGGEKVLDVPKLLASFSGDMQLLKMIAEVFMDSLPRLVYDIRDACLRGDSEALWRHAHSLKGSVSYFSTEATARSALQLEVIGRSGDLADANTAYKALEAELVRLKPALAAFVREYAS